jgi:hypothetical protein
MNATQIAPTVDLLNAWTGARVARVGWTQIEAWAARHVHEDDRDQWLEYARVCFDHSAGDELGAMILGS